MPLYGCFSLPPTKSTMKTHKKVAKNPQFEGKFLIYASPTQNNVKEEKSPGGWNFLTLDAKIKA